VAADQGDVAQLSKGQAAPFDGLLLSNDKAKTIKQELLDKDQLDAINASLNKSLDLYKSNEQIYTDKVNILSSQNTDLAKSLNDARTTSNWEKALWFSIGFLVPMAAFYGIRSTTK
jgi:hypothetical protein